MCLHNILEPMLGQAPKKELKTIVDSFNLVEPLDMRLHVSPMREKYICASEGVSITT
jgi:hypothetical protein